MKITLTSPFGVLAVVLVIASCTKNNDPALPTCQLVSSSFTSAGQTTTQTFTYNANKQLISSTSTANGSSFITTYTYDSEGKLIYVSTDQVFSLTYFYDSNHQLIKDSTNFFNGGTPSWVVRKYTYNTHGQLSDTEEIQSACASCGSTTTYAYPNTSTKNYSSSTTNVDGTTYTILMEYNDHLILDKSGIIIPSTTDNYTSKMTVNFGSTTNVLTYSYVFNSRGYPTSVTMTSAEPSLSYTNLMTYSCP